MFILLKKTDEYKGILIFTHNETEYIIENCNHLNKDYYFIQHVQFNINNINRNKIISLHLMPQYNVQYNNDINIATNVLIYKKFYYKMLENDKNHFISLLQKYNINIEYKNEIKIIDFLYVGRCNDLKKTIDILYYFIYIATYLNKKCCFLILDQKNNECFYKKKFDKIYNELNDNIKKNIIMFDTSKLQINNNKMFFGLNLDEVCLFYKNSKIYIHACENEGGSRSIHEAICSGCYIMVKSNMIGGGLDNFQNECQYTLYNNENFKEQINEAIEKQKKYICKEKYIKNISEIYMLDILLNIIYNRLNYSNILEFNKFIDICKKNTNYIQLKMAAHDLSVTWYIKNELTSTIKTNEQLNKFYKSL